MRRALLLTARRYVLVSVTRRQHRQKTVTVDQKFVPVQGGFGACFCHPGRKDYEDYVCRGTKMIGATRLSPVTNLAMGTGAVSRYNFERSQKIVKVHRVWM